jgi:hypothetical protein
MKVIIGMAVVAVLAGLATIWLRHRGEDLLHHSFDTALPSKVEAHPWATLGHDKPLGGDRVSFKDGTLTTRRCGGVLGTYTIRINHSFSFTKSPFPVRAGCPGRKLRDLLSRASRVDVESHGGAQRLVFENADGQTVVRLRGRS